MNGERGLSLGKERPLSRSPQRNLFGVDFARIFFLWEKKKGSRALLKRNRLGTWYSEKKLGGFDKGRCFTDDRKGRLYWKMNIR